MFRNFNRPPRYIPQRNQKAVKEDIKIEDLKTDSNEPKISDDHSIHIDIMNNETEVPIDNIDSGTDVLIDIMDHDADTPINIIFKKVDIPKHKKAKFECIKEKIQEIDIAGCTDDIRADIVVKSTRCVRVWGQVTTYEGDPVEDAFVKLIKAFSKTGEEMNISIADTITDCKGFYQFYVCDVEAGEKYWAIVSKPAKGKERELDMDACENWEYEE